jgi:hypothetical protein
MRLISKIVAGTLLTIGVPVIVLTGLEITNVKTPPSVREDSIVAMVIIGWVPVTIGGAMVWSARRRDRQQERDRLRQIFYELLKEGNGEITTMQFAMASGLNGKEAMPASIC